MKKDQKPTPETPIVTEPLTVTARVPANEKKGTPEMSCAVTVTTGKTLQDMVALFSEEAIKTNAEANWIVSLQNNIRSGLRRGETCTQISERLSSAKMGVPQRPGRVDPIQAYLAKFQAATPEEQQRMLDELKKRASVA